MKIKDISLSNTVAGEGVMCWKVEDHADRVVNLDLPGYHIAGVEVCLLSPQLLLSTFGGHTTQTRWKLEVWLENGLILHAHLCPQSCLLLLLFVPSDTPTSFWYDAFAYSVANVAQTANHTLSSSQKELLLWHQHLSHANLTWIQNLMHDRKWLNDPKAASSLHTGPFISSSSWAPTCDVWGLKCSACLFAEVTTRTSKIISKPLLLVKTNLLKRSHLVPGSCVSVDHYMSSVMRRLPHTFEREQIGSSCGTLFVDHASGKLFNFFHYSTNAIETISSKHCLESLAWQEGISIKKYHADNGVFALNVFKEDCASLDQRYLFNGVGAHHQNRIAEQNIKTVAQWACINMLHFACHWPAKPMSASGHSQLIMPYGFSTACLILWMVYCQTKSGPLVALQLRNLMGHMCLVVQSMLSMQPYKMDTKYLNGRCGLVLEFFLGSLLCIHPRCPLWWMLIQGKYLLSSCYLWWQIWNSGVNELRGINWWTMDINYLFEARIFQRCLWWSWQCDSTSSYFTLSARWFCKWGHSHFTKDSWSQQHHLSSASRCP